MRTSHALAVAAALAAAAGSIASAQQPAVAPPEFASANLTESGARALAASCAICHGTEGRAAQGSSVVGLAGRPSAQLVAMMAQFRDGTRPATIMHQIVKGYTEAEIAAIADWFAKQSP